MVGTLTAAGDVCSLLSCVLSVCSPPPTLMSVPLNSKPGNESPENKAGANVPFEVERQKCAEMFSLIEIFRAASSKSLQGAEGHRHKLYFTYGPAVMCIHDPC